MGLNRNAAQLKSYDRLERESYRRDEDRLKGAWDREADKFLLGPRPKRGALYPVDGNLIMNHEWFPLFPSVCMHCWTGLVPANDRIGSWDTNTRITWEPKAVKGTHVFIQDQIGDMDPNDIRDWVHAATAHSRCYRDAGCRATYMPGIYVIEEMGV